LDGKRYSFLNFFKKESDSFDLLPSINQGEDPIGMKYSTIRERGCNPLDQRERALKTGARPEGVGVTTEKEWRPHHRKPIHGRDGLP